MGCLLLFSKNATEGSVSHCKGTEYLNLENQRLKGLENTHQFLIGSRIGAAGGRGISDLCGGMIWSLDFYTHSPKLLFM